MFETRNACPACSCRSCDPLLEIPYSQPEVFRFLCEYYCHAKPDAISNRVSDGKLVIVECRKCGLIFQRDIPDEDFMRELYAEWIIEGDDLSPKSKPLPIEHYTYMASEAMHLLAEQRAIIGPGRRIRVLDFGMGWGAWLQMARSLGAAVYGAELSQPKIDYARSIGIPVLSAAEIRSMEFDIVSTEQVFEHVPHPAALLETLVAALAPTGFMKISVPPGAAVKSHLQQWNWSAAFENQGDIMPIHPLEHINCFTAEALDAFAFRYGLRRARLSVRRALAYSMGWYSIRSISKNVMRPIYRFGLRKGTYAIYRRQNGVVT